LGAHYQDQNSGHLCFGGEHDEMLSFSEVKARLPELVAGVEEREEKVVVTKDGRPAAVLVNMQKYARLKETIDVLSDPALMDQIAESKAFYRTRKKATNSGTETEFTRCAAVVLNHPVILVLTRHLTCLMWVAPPYRFLQRQDL